MGRPHFRSDDAWAGRQEALMNHGFCRIYADKSASICENPWFAILCKNYTSRGEEFVLVGRRNRARRVGRQHFDLNLPRCGPFQLQQFPPEPAFRYWARPVDEHIHCIHNDELRCKCMMDFGNHTSHVRLRCIVHLLPRFSLSPRRRVSVPCCGFRLTSESSDNRSKADIPLAPQALQDRSHFPTDYREDCSALMLQKEIRRN